jgi:hypothetical protein
MNTGIGAVCEAFSVRRLSRQEFQINLKFGQLDTVDYELIDTYIESRLAGEMLIETVCATTRVAANTDAGDTKQETRDRIIRAA